VALLRHSLPYEYDLPAEKGNTARVRALPFERNEFSAPSRFCEPNRHAEPSMAKGTRLGIDKIVDTDILEPDILPLGARGQEAIEHHVAR
jgi:hypothetical protein